MRDQIPAVPKQEGKFIGGVLTRPQHVFGAALSSPS